MTPLDVLVIYGSTRHHRQGIKAARFIINECIARGHTATLVDPMELQLPLLDKMFKEFEPGQAPPVLTKLAGQIKAADAFIIVSGEYNHSIPPALSKPSRPLFGGVFLAAFGDRLLFSRLVWRRESRHAVAGDALRAGHAEHPVAAAGTGRARRL